MRTLFALAKKLHSGFVCRVAGQVKASQPLQCEYFALEGLSLLLKTVNRVQKGLNTELKIGGILFTMYDVRTRLAHDIVQEVTGYFKEKVFRTIIPRNVRLSEAPSFAKPINQYDPECIGARSYQKLAEEVLLNV